jgi:hypothetical protein
LFAGRGEQQSRYIEELAGRVEQQSRYIEEIKGLLGSVLLEEDASPIETLLSPVNGLRQSRNVGSIASSPEESLGKPSALRSTHGDGQRQLQLLGPRGPRGVVYGGTNGYGPVPGPGNFNLSVDTLEVLTAKVNGLTSDLNTFQTVANGALGALQTSVAAGFTSVDQRIAHVEQRITQLTGTLLGVEKKVQCVSADSDTEWKTVIQQEVRPPPTAKVIS